MSYAVTVYVSYAAGAERGRTLASFGEDRLSDVRARLLRNRDTWLGALEPGDPGFIAHVLDDDGEATCTIEYGRELAEPIEHGRASLRAMRAAR